MGRVRVWGHLVPWGRQQERPGQAIAGALAQQLPEKLQEKTFGAPAHDSLFSLSRCLNHLLTPDNPPHALARPHGAVFAAGKRGRAGLPSQLPMPSGWPGSRLGQIRSRRVPRRLSPQCGCIARRPCRRPASRGTRRPGGTGESGLPARAEGER